MQSQLLCDSPAPTPVLPRVGDWVESVRAPPGAPILRPFPSSYPVLLNQPAPLRRCLQPASCWTPRAVVQSGISAAKSDSHGAPASCRSGLRGSRLQPPLAAQTVLPKVGPRRRCDSTKDTDRLTIAAPHRCPHRPAGQTDTPQEHPRSCLFARAFPRARRASLVRLGPVVL